MLGPESIKAVEQESKLLRAVLTALEDALEHHAIDDWVSVWSTINTLTDGNEIDKLIHEVPPKSMFHKSGLMVNGFVSKLRYWQGLGFFGNQDSMLKVQQILEERLTEDELFLIQHRTKPPSSG